MAETENGGLEVESEHDEMADGLIRELVQKHLVDTEPLSLPAGFRSRLLLLLSELDGEISERQED